MTPKISILNTSATLFLLGCLIYLITNWSVLFFEKSLELVLVFALILFGISGLIIDAILAFYIANRFKVNVIELVLVLLTVIAVPIIKNCC